MRPLTTLALTLSLLTWAYCARAETQCQLKLLTSANLTLSPSGALLVDATLNDEPVQMAVDTSRPIGGITIDTVRRLGLPTGSLRDYRGGAFAGDLVSAIDTWVDVKRWTLGRVVSADVRLVELLIPGDGRNDSFAGIIGADYLKNYDVELDIAKGNISLYAQDHCPGKVVYWRNDYYILPFSGRGGNMTFIVEMDGHRIRATIDTGSSQTVLNTGSARQLFAVSDDTPGREKVAGIQAIDGHLEPAFRYTFQSLNIGNIAVGSPKVLISSIGVRNPAVSWPDVLTNAAPPDMLIGTNVIRGLHLFIAYSENKIYYTPATPKP